MLSQLNFWILKTFLEVKGFTLKLRKDEAGAGTVEYAMIIAVVVVMIIAATAVMDTPLQDFFKAVVAKISKQSGV